MQATKPAQSPWVWIALCLTLGLVLWVNLQEEPAEETLQDSLSMPASTFKPAQATRQATTNVQVTQAAQASPPTVNDDTAKPHQQTSTSVEVTNTTQSTLARAHIPLPKATPLFAVQQWVPPPAKPAPPPPPTAPRLPYSYIGTFDDMPEGKTVLLMQQNKMSMIKVGAKINGEWRLDREDVQQVYFTYLPLNQSVALNKAAKPVVGNRPLANQGSPENPDDDFDPPLDP